MHVGVYAQSSRSQVSSADLPLDLCEIRLAGPVAQLVTELTRITQRRATADRYLTRRRAAAAGYEGLSPSDGTWLL